MKAQLDKNEMPESPPDTILNAIKNSIKYINRYTPQKKVDNLKTLLAEYNNINKEYFFLSPGSDILIKEFIFLHSNIEQIIIPDPTFIIIENAVGKTSSSILKVKLSAPEFQFPHQQVLSEIDKSTLVVIDNPNNPTGKIIIDKEGIEQLLNNQNVILLIDEAYFEFSRQTVIELIEKYPNFAILRTLSKSFGLAGSGIGYMIASKDIMKRFSGLEIMLPYPSVIAAIAALKNRNYLDEYINSMQKEKEKMLERVNQLNIDVYPSKTNFLLMGTDQPDIAKKLAEKEIYVYDASNYLSPGYIRVTIGNKKENAYFLDVLENILID